MTIFRKFDCGDEGEAVINLDHIICIYPMADNDKKTFIITTHRCFISHIEYKFIADELELYNERR